jgi:zinc transport system substrate-binding protein
MRNLLATSALALSISSPLLADAPRVVADISPVHSLVARVMQGIGEPDVILSPGASPHSYSMRPSDARRLSKADLVVWIGEPLTPWLEQPLENLAGNAVKLELLEAPDTLVLPFREAAVFADDDEDHAGHDDHHEGHDKHHDDHADHDEHHNDHADHDEHKDDHDEHEDHAAHDDHGHDHDGDDPHAWLDPVNAQVWLNTIADALSGIDPENAGAYAANAAAGRAEIVAAMTSISAKLSNSADKRFVVFHDAYQYFDRRFGLQVIGALNEGDASSAGAARIAEIREEIAHQGVSCAFSEPQYDPGLLSAVFEEGTAKIAVLDPLGAGLTPGAGLYVDLLNNLADAVAGC